MHDNKSPRLMTQAEVKAQATSILDAAVYTDAMPAGGSMTLDERKLLGEWLPCGARCAVSPASSTQSSTPP
jgi:uncharacterized membrane protein